MVMRNACRGFRVLLIVICSFTAWQVIAGSVWGQESKLSGPQIAVVPHQMYFSGESLWVTVAGANLRDVKVSVFSVTPQAKRTLVVPESGFNSYLDFPSANKIRNRFRVLRVKRIPSDAIEKRLDVVVKAYGTSARPAQITQIGTSIGTKQFIKQLRRGRLGRDQLVVVPDRFQQKEVDRVLVNLYCVEQQVCRQLRIYGKGGRLLTPKPQWIPNASRPKAIPWDFKKQQPPLLPGRYEVRMWIRYAPHADCRKLGPKDRPDYVLPMYFDVLP